MPVRNLVIGSKGLIGRSLTKNLAINSKVETYDIRINKDSLVQLYGCYDNIFVAAFSGITSYGSYESCIQNLELNNVIINSINSSNISFSRIYIIGSNAEYHENSKSRDPIPDGLSGKPYDMFTFTKQLIYNLYLENYSSKVFYAKPFYVYSEESPKGLFQYIKKNLDSGNSEIAINTALNVIDWVHALDVGRAIAFHADNRITSNAFNIGSGYNHSIYNLLHTCIPDQIHRFKFNQIGPVSHFISENTTLAQNGYTSDINIEKWLPSFLFPLDKTAP